VARLAGNSERRFLRRAAAKRPRDARRHRPGGLCVPRRRRPRTVDQPGRRQGRGNAGLPFLAAPGGASRIPDGRRAGPAAGPSVRFPPGVLVVAASPRPLATFRLRGRPRGGSPRRHGRNGTALGDPDLEAQAPKSRWHSVCPVKYHQRDAGHDDDICHMVGRTSHDQPRDRRWPAQAFRPWRLSSDRSGSRRSVGQGPQLCPERMERPVPDAFGRYPEYLRRTCVALGGPFALQGWPRLLALPELAQQQRVRHCPQCHAAWPHHPVRRGHSAGLALRCLRRCPGQVVLAVRPDGYTQPTGDRRLWHRQPPNRSPGAERGRRVD
jgi:hypothetical protein